MPATNLSFAKIVATPSLSSWSQAYNAGSLFIVLSLTSEDEEIQKDLAQKGKDILNKLETEFFALEEKTYDAIKAAVTQIVTTFDPEITYSLSLTSVKENALYAFVVGTGRITLKRGDKLGVIVENRTESEKNEIQSASGYLETDDIILIQTSQFADSVPAKTIIQALDYGLPNDIAETISPHVHGATEGGATAIVLSYKGTAPDPLDEITEESVLPAAAEPSPTMHEDPPQRTHEPIEEATSSNENSERRSVEETSESESSPKERSSFLPSFSVPSLAIPKQKKIILGAVILLLVLLMASIFFVRSNEQSSKNQALFQDAYTSAKKDYDEGEGLLSLNKSLALDDYKSAASRLEKIKGVFKEGTPEATKIKELNDLIQKRLAETSGVAVKTAKQVDGTDAPSLKVCSNDVALISCIEDAGTIYTLSDKTITSMTTSSEAKKDLVKNDDDWSTPKSLGIFSGNFYVLDSKDGLLKFVPTAASYEKSTYFKGTAPDLSKAVSLAIDSSIYILFSDGSLKKFTRGTEDTFSLSGVDKAFSAPTALFASPDIDNIYVLDSGNSRIVKLSNSGTFQSEYQADILKTARQLFVSKDEKAAYVLAGSKIYQLDL